VKILSAAMRLFAREGYEGASMSAIAAAAGVTKPVLYDHFSSKEELFTTILRSLRDELMARGQEVERSSVCDEAKFRAAVDLFFEFVEARPDAARLLLIIPKGSRAAAALSREVQRGATMEIANLLRTLLQKRKDWEHAAVAEFLKEGLHALAIWWLENPGASRDNIVTLVMATCWSGLQIPKTG
jgi:AcrR family transcriptional regulator